MNRGLKLALGSAALFALAGCVEDTGGTSAPAGVPGNSLEGQARTNCVAAVQRTTGNSNVSVIRSSFSEAGTEVILQVGPTGTWRCIGYRDGTTAGIMSLTNEGSL